MFSNDRYIKIKLVLFLRDVLAYGTTNGPVPRQSYNLHLLTREMPRFNGNTVIEHFYFHPYPSNAISYKHDEQRNPSKRDFMFNVS